MAKNSTPESTTQQFLDIFDITNNLVIMKDGTTSLIITVDAMNFGLLAEEEQDSIMYAYAGLLNSLNYPIQILIKSQTKDVTGYLNLLKEREDNTINRTQQKRIQRYREFVGNLIRERNVLDKKFYVVVPARPIELGLLSPTGVIPGKKAAVDITSVDKSHILEKARNLLEPKRDHLIAQFARIGLYSRQLETQEVIQLFYTSYNPEASEGQHIDDSNSYSTPLVKAKVTKDIFMDNTSQTPAVAANPEEQQEPLQTSTEPVDTLPLATNNIPEAPKTPTNNTEGSTYAPTQMPSNHVVPASPTQDITTPATIETPVVEVPRESTVIPAPESGTNLPPAPELPKTNPSTPDPSVPIETTIKIEHPSDVSMTSAPVDQQTQAPAAESAMPPVAEIS